MMALDSDITSKLGLFFQIAAQHYSQTARLGRRRCRLVPWLWSVTVPSNKSCPPWDLSSLPNMSPTSCCRYLPPALSDAIKSHSNLGGRNAGWTYLWVLHRGGTSENFESLKNRIRKFSFLTILFKESVSLLSVQFLEVRNVLI